MHVLMHWREGICRCIDWSHRRVLGAASAADAAADVQLRNVLVCVLVLDSVRAGHSKFGQHNDHIDRPVSGSVPSVVLRWRDLHQIGFEAVQTSLGGVRVAQLNCSVMFAWKPLSTSVSTVMTFTIVAAPVWTLDTKTICCANPGCSACIGPLPSKSKETTSTSEYRGTAVAACDERLADWALTAIAGGCPYVFCQTLRGF